ncbi:MAG: polyribonucleotide nucleotidyltransferase [Candidatus Cloacimonadota bacterium]|nr:polyribonucleotide nucleotidyltransferase [Candidatus Cloacimonadota bacterium]
MLKKMIRMETEFAGRKLTLETGRMAKQANGSVFVQYGGTSALVTATVSKTRREGMDYFPLVVDFVEKMYASGKIPGGFFKREAKPSTNATLTARLIDRPIRPLFPNGFRNEVQVIVTVLSYDKKNSPEVVGMLGASAALSISNIPFHGPIAGVKVGLIDDELIINPNLEQMENSALDLSVAGKENAIMMVEGGAYEISEEKMVEALDFAHTEIKKIIEFQNEFIEKAGIEKTEFEYDVEDKEMLQEVSDQVKEKLKVAVVANSKEARQDAIDEVKADLIEFYEEKFDEDEFKEKKSQIYSAFDNTISDVIRSKAMNEGKRIDGRGFDDIREITCDVDILAQTHGSALFTRGETQSLGVTTLGTGSDEKMIDNLDEMFKKSFYLDYNFPPFSVGEVKFLRGPGRRELGHGHLAERALIPVIPTTEEFPYTIRIVSEILESNGSSSMATVCTGSMSLMAAGVPIKRPVAGIANGLIIENGKHVILTDILGTEDHYGDMDFKVTGTELGITALQMDIKVEGITREIMSEALQKAKISRKIILNKIVQTIESSRSEVSEFAPKISIIQIDKKKIGHIIGPGGKIINAIIDETGVTIDIDDDGSVRIGSTDAKMMELAKKKILGIVEEPELGKIYRGKVKGVKDFGAFVEYLPHKEGLVHISNLAKTRTKNTTDVVNIGDEVNVKVIKIDDNGKVGLTMKFVNQDKK